MSISRICFINPEQSIIVQRSIIDFGPRECSNSLAIVFAIIAHGNCRLRKRYRNVDRGKEVGMRKGETVTNSTLGIEILGFDRGREEPK